MAARTNRIHQTEKTREKIRTTKLIQLSESMVFNEEFEGKRVELSSERVSAIKMLLAKSLPDLSSVAITGENGGPLVITHKSE